MQAPAPLRRRLDAAYVVLDVCSAASACLVAYWLRFQDIAVPHSLQLQYVRAAAVACVLWTAVARATGLYRRSAIRAGVRNVEEAFEGALIAGVVMFVAQATPLARDLSRAWIGLVTLGLMLGGVASRMLLRRLRRSLVPVGMLLERYVVVGDEAAGRRLLADLTRAAGAPFKVVSVLPSGLAATEVAQRARDLRADGLIVPDGELNDAEIAQLAAAVSGHDIDVLLAPGLGGLELRVASIVMLHGVPLLRTAGLSPRRTAIRTPARRDLSRGVAILGTRGIPANYGGFETFAEHLALGLVDSDIPVTVYCRTHYASGAEEWKGVGLVTLPTLRTKYLDTVVHTGISALHVLLRTRIRDVVMCNAANAPFVLLLRLFGCRVILNVDGLEWRRGKWGVAGRTWYRLGEWLSVRFASVLVTDAEEVRTYYRVRHDTDSVMIPYGADVLARGSVPVPEAVPVEPEWYALYVSRWENENNPVLVATAHARSEVGLALVMLGRATYDDEIDARLRAVVADNVVLPGPLFGDDYRGLQANALCYVHATEVGGTHPALIEALGAGNVCLVMDTPENREVVGEHGRFFADAEELAEHLRWVSTADARTLKRLREAGQDYVRERYSWSTVVHDYLEVLRPRDPW